MASNQDDCKRYEEDIDKLKFRNEIEAFARLKGLGSISGLYDNSINDKVSSSLCEVYHEGPNLSLESPGDMFNSLVNKPDNIDKQSDNNSTAKLECAAVDDVIKDSNHISWDSYFMNIAILASLRSKDTTKVGAVIVHDRKILGVGYNGFPSGIDESKLPTGRDGEWLDTKYPYVVHAELNAILNTVKHDIHGSSLYVTMFPCCTCVATILQKKISEIIYLSDKHHNDKEYVASRKLLSLSNINIRQFSGDIVVKNYN